MALTAGIKKSACTIGVMAAAAGMVGGGLAGTANAKPGIANISVGSGNSHGVWCVQRAVNNWAERTGQGRPIGEDGKFGTATKTWVVKFQKASKLPADGIVGPKTGNSVLDNAGHHRGYCYDHVPSTRR
ncbi:peptidoglycan-binding domain-containing protein [Streptomyces syringium]|uniref:peptidoglycan-binding domain-containing protein n=1 Tax=Streptomyces syringium TaxID=76729 RepID=UPI003421AA2C